MMTISAHRCFTGNFQFTAEITANDAIFTVNEPLFYREEINEVIARQRICPGRGQSPP